MQTGYVLLFWVFPIFLEGCCVKSNQHYKTGPRMTMPQQRYRVVEGEMFLMPCTNNTVVTWYQITGDRKEDGSFSFDCGSEFLIEAKHSGNYTLLTGKIFLYLQVLDKQRLPCYIAEEGGVMLLAGAGGTIPCPGFNCTESTGVTWYKGDERMSKMYRDLCVKNGQLHLCTVSHYDTGQYFCDTHFVEQGVEWTFRRPVTITAIPFKEVSAPPRITLPDNSTAQEVEFGEPHTMTCLVHFPFELNFSPRVQWYINYGGNVENRTLLRTESQQQVTRKVTFKEFMVNHTDIIREVTPLHLNHTYTCMASNAVGNRNATVKLKRKNKKKWPSLVGYPIASLLLVAGVGIVLHVKWLELQLIYKSHFQSGKLDEDEKEFDVFLSYVWTTPHEQAGLTLFSRSGPESDDYPSTLEPFNFQHVIDDLRPPEMLIPMVLEDVWGYRLCLLERDMLPGGAYTNDVMHAIRRSQILICVVSAEYLSNSNAVFVLESGIQILLQSSTLKLLLIRTSRTSKCFVEPDSPLPPMVRRALTVLPSLDWNLGQSEKVNGKFWTLLRKALPKNKVRLVTGVISHAHFGHNDHRNQE
ncbi:interleukin-18 receptor accessory protein-like isoform X1 [Hippocampus zosterae]|uniref:interleukin-18 receptor accessory protein-like isoform X1 n=1 Tax=Hippocampus zosterae TaxID=109293 RepID=UPI00223D4959|nr:interleukin-18 receptor accessory protein-like isoform X1 [Hippocampus zosterae]